MAKLDVAELKADKAKLELTIKALEPTAKNSPELKALLDGYKNELKELEQNIADNKLSFVLGDIEESFADSMEKALRQCLTKRKEKQEEIASFRYTCRYNVDNDIIEVSCDKLAIGRGGNIVLTRNTNPLPASVKANITGKEKEYKLTGSIKQGLKFNTHEKAFIALLACAPELQKEYEANDKYKRSSARERWERITKMSMALYFDESKKETASETASKELEKNDEDKKDKNNK